MAQNDKKQQKIIDRCLKTISESRYRLLRLDAKISSAKSTGGVSTLEGQVQLHARKIQDASATLSSAMLGQLGSMYNRFEVMEAHERDAKAERERIKAEKKKAKAKPAKKVAKKAAKKAAKAEIKAAKPAAAFPFPADPPVQPTKPATIEPSKPAKAKKVKAAPKGKAVKKAPKAKKGGVSTGGTGLDHDKMANTLDPRSAVGLAAVPSGRDTPMGALQSDGGAY